MGNPTDCTRRTFLKGVGALIAAGMLPGWVPNAPPPDNWVLEQTNNLFDGPWEEVKGWRGKIRYDPSKQPEGNLGALLMPEGLLTKPFSRLRRTDREMSWIEESALSFYDEAMLKRLGRWGKPNCCRG